MKPRQKVYTFENTCVGTEFTIVILLTNAKIHWIPLHKEYNSLLTTSQGKWLVMYSGIKKICVLSLSSNWPLFKMIIFV